MSFHHGSGRGNPARTEQMISLARSGLTLAQIGERYGLTRERVRQILSAHGVPREIRGVAIRAESRRRSIQARVSAYAEQRCMRSYGCSVSEYRLIRGDIPPTDRSSPIIAFREQRNNSSWRGIQFSLTLTEWHRVWVESGHYHERGRGHGKYVMSRIGDRGAYEVGNVFIQLADENNREYQLRRQRQMKLKAA